MWATTFVLVAVFFSTLLQHIVCYSMSPPATKRKHPGVHHRNKRIPPWGSSLTARMNNPGWKFGVGSLIEKNSLHFQSKPLIDAICSPMLNRVLERLPGMPIKIVLNLKLRIHSSLNGLRRLRPLLIMWFKLH